MKRLYLPDIEPKYLAVLHEGSVRKKSGIKGYILWLIGMLLVIKKKNK